MPFRTSRLWVIPLLMLLTATRASFGLITAVTLHAAVDKQPLAQGTTARIAIQMTIDPAYHVQSVKPLDKYLIPARVTIKAPDGITAADPRFPIAQEIPASPAVTTAGKLSVYEGTVYIQIPLTIAPDAPLGDKEITLSIRTQACDEKSCLPPKTITLKLPIKIAAAGTASTPQEPDLFTAADKQPYAEPAPSTSQPTTTTTTTTTTQAAAPTNTPTIALMTTEEQLAAINSRNYHPANHAEQEYSTPLLILFALLGGIVLNIMPCVLPVIPLKVLSLVQQAHGERRAAILHGLTFSAGVVSLFVALAIVLKTFGLFYGQQFQSPAFVIAMVMFVIALALSMIGVWTINPPTAVYTADAKIAEYAHAGEVGYASTHGKHSSPYLGSFASGLMATLLATPCSAPYLGSVLAWALTQTVWLTVLMLALVGVGMSLPYLLLAAFPGWLQKVPRAGRWSELLKQGLGIVMLGVAVYLVTLVSDVRLWPWILVGGVVVSLICWGWGQLPKPGASGSQLWTPRLTTLLIGLLLGAGVFYMGQRSQSTQLPTEAASGDWTPFNVALLDAGLKSGRPVVVDWGADWCINCRVLEGTVLSSDAVKKSFATNNALLLRADLSNDNPPADLLNRKLGGEAIPALAIFSPNKPLEPTVLRDSYTSTRVIDELSAAK